MVFTAVDMYLMDIGNAASTEYDFNDTSWLNAFDENPELMGLKIGLVHTHHNMSTFYSGTDLGHLHGQAPFHNYFLSLIVNFACEPIAKVAFASTRKVNSSFSFKDDDGNIQSQISNKEEDITVVFNCDVFVEIEPTLLDRINQLKEVKESRNRQIYTKHDYTDYNWPNEVSNEKVASIWDTQGKRLQVGDIQTELNFDKKFNRNTTITDQEIEEFLIALLANSYNDYSKTIKDLVEERNLVADTNSEAQSCTSGTWVMFDAMFNNEAYFTEVVTKCISILGKYKNDFSSKMITILKKEMNEFCTEL